MTSGSEPYGWPEFSNLNFHCVFHACLLFGVNIPTFPILVVVSDWMLVVNNRTLNKLSEGSSSRVSLIGAYQGHQKLRILLIVSLLSSKCHRDLPS